MPSRPRPWAQIGVGLAYSNFFCQNFSIFTYNKKYDKSKQKTTCIEPFGLKCVALLPYSVALLCISAPNQPPFFCHRHQLADLPLLSSHCLWQGVNRCGRWFQSQYQKAKQKGHPLMSFCFGFNVHNRYRCF